MFPIAQSVSMPALSSAAGGTLEWPSVGVAFTVGLIVLLIGSTVGLLRARASTTPDAQDACTGGDRPDFAADDVKRQAA